VARLPDLARQRHGLLRTTVLTVVFGVISVLPGAAQDVTEPSLKAAFVYNLAKFTEWPADVLPASAPLVACIMGESPVAQALERIVKGRMVMGHSVSVVRLSGDEPHRSCHLLYAAGLTTAEVGALGAAAQGSAILTIIDSDAATRPPMIAHLFIENGKLRFDLDHGRAKRSRLQLSSKLLPLAKRVYDGSGGAAP
jgi:hypothetical protein